MLSNHKKHKSHKLCFCAFCGYSRRTSRCRIGTGCGSTSRRVPPRGARVMGGGPPGSAGVSPACRGARCAGRPGGRDLPLRTAQFPWDVAPVHPAGGNGMGSAEAESRRRRRSTPVEEMGEVSPVLCGRDARVPGWGRQTSGACSTFVKSLTDSARVRVYSGAEGSKLTPAV